MSRIIAVLLILLPLPSLADIGDVYYCASEKLVEVNETGKLEQYKSEKFKFKWERDQLVFSDFPIMTFAHRSWKINSHTKSSVSAGGYIWGILNFNTITGVLVALIPRKDIGLIIWAKCDEF